MLFLVFNRPETTRQVFKEIKRAKPPRLYVAADGPRESKFGEVELVEEVRKISTNVDWDCEVKILFREENLGCKFSVSNAISWFFDNEEQGIILEDDCVPSQSFFWFCEELLKKYKDDSNIYLISGDGRGSEIKSMKGDYGFSKYPLIWGWASWARVWRKYDVHINDWKNNRIIIEKRFLSNRKMNIYWGEIFDKVSAGEINTWDYQLVYLLLVDSAQCIVPRLNLITNIGFGIDATHTINFDRHSANIPRFEINFPLIHFEDLDSGDGINRRLEQKVFGNRSIGIKIKNRILNILSRQLKFKK